MPAQISEAIVLRTYPLKEADLIVSFFTRDQGKMRGVANRARRPKHGFGSALERLTQVRIHYTSRENRELVRIDTCDLVYSQFDLASNYSAGVALDVMAEISEHLLPPHEANDRYYRLLASVLAFLRANGEKDIWQALLYFEVWAVRLSGFLPDLNVAPESQQILSEILKTPLVAMPPRHWSGQTARDLRRLLTSLIETHIERRLLTKPILESLA
jgi:DNA repair protein RecO (recombination protein O)